MNKQQLIEEIATQPQLTLEQSKVVLAVTFEAIRQDMVTTDSINILGLGGFGSEVHVARKGRNPSIVEEIQIAAATVPYFKASAQQKVVVNQKALT